MKKNNKLISLRTDLQNKIDKLDRNKIHILYFSYDFSFYNIYHSPLLLTTKILNFLKGDASIDHVCHISRFTYDRSKKRYIAKIFEANTKRGMEENFLYDRLKNFKGVCYIETIDQYVDKQLAKNFEKKFFAVKYSKVLAAFSGIDFSFLDKILKRKKPKGGFCSWLVSIFLINQNIDIKHIENGDPKEIVPADLFNGNFGNIEILYEYKK